MRFIADLHTHSHFSRATSRNLDPEHLILWAQKKGITVIGTGDFTHSGWISELREKLVNAEKGLYCLRPELEKAVKKDLPESCKGAARFLLSSEISCIYKRDGKTRKVHHLILMPDFDSVISLNKKLERIGNITSDGRPILGLDSRDLLEMVLESSDNSFLIPAHVWTPWFSIFGSKSGFDSIEECFGDLTSHIYALETGLSSDPPMNRRLSSIDEYLLVSNSDAHSPSKLGREANIFNTELDYDQLLKAMINKEGFDGTIEFYPEEGKYHLDGHRKCRIKLTPKETRELKGICPSCGKALTVGVLHRVADLSDRERPKISKGYYSLIPLTEILSEILNCGPATKKVTSVYEELLASLGPELGILMDVNLRDIEDAGGNLLATAIDRMRRNKVIKQEGYDGEYGVIRLFHGSEKTELAGQRTLFQIKNKAVPDKKKCLSLKVPETDKPKGSTAKKPSISFDPILDPLNSAQKAAVIYDGGHLLIVAGPGTGKTMTLTHRIAHIIRSHRAKPEQILALTFTNKAAREMRNRIHALLPEHDSEKIRTATFHRFCVEFLRNEAGKLDLPPDFMLCSERDSFLIIEEVIAESDKAKRLASRLSKELYYMKMISVMDGGNNKHYQELLPVFQKYQDKLRNLGMLDLGDLEVETVRALKDHPELALKYSELFPKIFVDEYQDTNPLQVALLKGLFREGINEICAIGDPDQAIYGFRGADVGNFHRFFEDFRGAKEIVLSKNYRSTEFIIKGACDLLGRDKVLEGVSGRGEPICIGPCGTHSEEAEMVVEQIEKLMGGTSYFSFDSGRVSSHEDIGELGFGDIAVLFRMNSQGDAFEEAFLRAGLPFMRSGEKSLVSKYPVDIIWRFLLALHYPDRHYYLNAYLDVSKEKAIKGKDLLKECSLEWDLEELIDQAVYMHEFDLSEQQSAKAVGRLKALARNLKNDMGSLLDTLSMDRGIDHSGWSGDRIALMSLHAAKGLEWPVVFITGCEEMLIPCSLFGDYDESEEKRLLYVGMTRARRRLILSHAKKRVINGRMIDMNPSQFLDLISKDLFSPLERAQWKHKRKRHKQLGLFK